MTVTQAVLLTRLRNMALRTSARAAAGARSSIEDGVDGARPFELEKARVGDHVHEAVPQPSSLLALRRWRDHRPEKAPARDPDHRSADLIADRRGDGSLLSPQRRIVSIGLAGRSQRDGGPTSANAASWVGREFG